MNRRFIFIFPFLLIIFFNFLYKLNSPSEEFLHLVLRISLILSGLLFILLNKRDIKDFGFKKEKFLMGLLFSTIFLIIFVLIYICLTGNVSIVEFSFYLWLYKIIYYIILIGFPEELWFREIIYNEINNTEYNKILITAILFSLAHAFLGFQAVFWTFFHGLAFAMIRSRYNNIFSLSIYHGLLAFIVDFLI